MLLARTRSAADEAGGALLDRVVGDDAADETSIQAVHALMVATGAVASVADDVRRRAARGQELLEDAEELGALGREGLAALAAQATDVTSLPA